MIEEMPESPMSENQASMIDLHELLLDAMKAGFTREEAFTLVVEYLRYQNLDDLTNSESGNDE